MNLTQIKIKLEKGGRMPEKKSKTAACYDVYACLENDVIIPRFGTAIIPLGFRMEMDSSFFAEIRPRSGLASQGIVAQLGTIDSDYRGIVGAIITNYSPDGFRVKNGDRIAQMLFRYIHNGVLVEADELSETDRGDGGFGSTGK